MTADMETEDSSVVVIIKRRLTREFGGILSALDVLFLDFGTVPGH